jgi:hypothetical protein
VFSFRSRNYIGAFFLLFFFIAAFELVPVVWPADGVFGLPLVAVSMFCAPDGLPAPCRLVPCWLVP